MTTRERERDGLGRRGGDALPAKGMLRVPFVRRCQIEIETARGESAFIVNINVLGAYVARDEMPALGQTVHVRFDTPGHSVPVEVVGVVAWVNPRQTHPVHSLPPGFGMRFENLSPVARKRIEAVVRAWTAQQSHHGRM